MKYENLRPEQIEAESFKIIEENLGDKKLDIRYEHIIKRCIHTSADFEYADSLYFSDGVTDKIQSAMLNGCIIVTDTQMAKAGINKQALKKLGINVECYIADEDVSEMAKREGTTRAKMAVKKAVELGQNVIFAVGNAPTALIELSEYIGNGYMPIAVIGVPVGFVNVVQSKESIINSAVPCIVARGRKGGSNIAAAIINALMYNVIKINSIE